MYVQIQRCGKNVEFRIIMLFPYKIKLILHRISFFNHTSGSAPAWEFRYIIGAIYLAPWYSHITEVCRVGIRGLHTLYVTYQCKSAFYINEYTKKVCQYKKITIHFNFLHSFVACRHHFFRCIDRLWTRQKNVILFIIRLILAGCLVLYFYAQCS